MSVAIAYAPSPALGWGGGWIYLEADDVPEGGYTSLKSVLTGRRPDGGVRAAERSTTNRMTHF